MDDQSQARSLGDERSSLPAGMAAAIASGGSFGGGDRFGGGGFGGGGFGGRFGGNGFGGRR